MLFVALAMSVYVPAFAGFQGSVNWIQEYLPRSLPRSAWRHVRPLSVDTMTSLIPYPPDIATPMMVTGLFTLSFSPSAGETIRERVVMRLIGTVREGLAPGGTQPHAVSGMR